MKVSKLIVTKMNELEERIVKLENKLRYFFIVIICDEKVKKLTLINNSITHLFRS